MSKFYALNNIMRSIMKYGYFFSAFIWIITLSGIIGISQAQNNNETVKKDGKTIFTDSKCPMCHSITNEGITAMKKGNAPDLSDVGTRFKADFMKKYLIKEATLNDKKHLIKFKGEEADLDTLVNWLANLTSPPKMQ